MVDNSDKSSIVQTIEASGNFLNNIKNPWFFLVLILMIGGGFIAYKATYIIASSIDNLSEKMDKLNTNLIQPLTELKVKNEEQENTLKDILTELNNERN